MCLKVIFLFFSISFPLLSTYHSHEYIIYLFMQKYTQTEGWLRSKNWINKKNRRMWGMWR
jgi:hypothetical protein